MNERQKRASIGIDVGGTKSLFVLFDSSFKVVDEIKIKTPKEKESFVRSVNVCIGKLIDTSAAKQLRVTALGVGCAGTIDTKKGIVRTSPNLPALENFSFEQAITA